MPPQFSRDVPTDPRGPAFLILRTPASTPMEAIVTSEDILGCYTHYHHGRTIPHEETDCPGCDDLLPYRWHSYMTAFDDRANLHFLFEVTRQAALHFAEYRDAHGNLRGCMFRATRHKDKPNGRVLLKLVPAKLSNYILPKAPDLVKVLTILWGIPADAVDHTYREPESKTTALSFRDYRKQRRTAG